jgi:diaminopimelate epimerase
MNGIGSMDFLKLHGLGNDFVLLDELEGEKIPEGDREGLAIRLCDRHTGIGGDGVLFIGRKDGQVSFRIFNADGSEAEMCVNGIRCAALALKLRLAPELGDEVEISTKGGNVKTEVKELSGNTSTVQVQTYFDPKYLGHKEIEVEGVSLDYHLVNVGNPHAVAFVEEPVSEVAVEKIGHALEHHEEFPEGVNTEFVNRIAPGRLRMRVHERGACETQACGSGAIASATAASQLESSQNSWVVEMLGGPLNIEFDDRTIIEGPATLVFEGRIDL